MSDVTNDPISELQPDASPEDAREIAAALVRSGQMSVMDANKVLAGKGAVPLVEGSLEEALASKARLMRDHSFRQWARDDDPDAIRMLTELNARIARGGPEKLTDRPAEPASAYRFDTATRPEFRETPDKAIVKFDEDATAWAQDLRLSPDLARHVVSAAHDADRVQDREAFEREQTQLFERVIGPDSEARLVAAQKVLDETSARKVDLAGLVKSAGAEVAISLILHAEHLQATRKR